MRRSPGTARARPCWRSPAGRPRAGRWRSPRGPPRARRHRAARRRCPRRGRRAPTPANPISCWIVRSPTVVSNGSAERSSSRTSGSWTASTLSPSACSWMISWIDLGVLALDDDELAEQPEPDALAHVLQRGRLLEAFPGGGQRKLARVDDGAAEERPARDDQVVGVGDQHALRVDAVARAVAGSRGVGQHEGQPDHARRRRVDRDDAHRLEPEALPAPGQLLLGGELPRGRPLRDRLGPDPHRARPAARRSRGRTAGTRRCRTSGGSRAAACRRTSVPGVGSGCSASPMVNVPSLSPTQRTVGASGCGRSARPPRSSPRPGSRRAGRCRTGRGSGGARREVVPLRGSCR